jgi:regulator of replication initiation timing
MRPAEHAPEAIIEAGQALQAAGRNITGFALRQKVGGGNPSRLKQVWDEHLASQSVARAEPVAELPVEVAEEMTAVTKALTERLAALAVELNDKAVKAAERRVHEIVRTAGEQRAQAERELADASQTVEDLESRLDQANADTDSLKVKLEASEGARQTQAVELAQVRERLAVTEQAAKTAEAQQAQALKIAAGQHAAELLRIEDAARREAEQLSKALDEGDHSRTAAQAAREDAAKLRGQVEALQSQAAQLLRAIGQQGSDAPSVGVAAPASKTPGAKKGD